MSILMLFSRKFNSPCTGYFDVCCNMTNAGLFETTTEKYERPQGCGYHNPGLSPWSGAILFQESHQAAPRLYKCGFSLIHQQVGMTAAHCLEETEGIYTVQIGNY